MKKNKKVIWVILVILIVLLIVGIIYYFNNYNKLDDVLDCKENECKSTIYNDNEISYMFLDGYDDYLEYKKRYVKTFPEFKDEIRDYDVEFFEENKLVIMGAINCGINDILYDDTVAIINYMETNCAYQYGEINIIEVNKDTSSIEFNNQNLVTVLEGILDCENYQCKSTPSVVYRDANVNYMFLNSYIEYQEYKSKYIEMKTEFGEDLKDYDEEFFDKNKLIVFGSVNCGIGNIKYEDSLAIIEVNPTDCDYEPGHAIEVRQGTKRIEFNLSD